MLKKIYLAEILFLFRLFGLSFSTTGFTLEQGIPHFNTKPYFLPPTAYNLSALSGQSAYLHCRVAQLGDKKVSWIRRSDLHVLTSGFQTFSSDERFQALHQERSENWTLHIAFSQTRDSGEYQCQVNTEPRISMSFYLEVTEAATEITGSDQRYIKAGSQIKLSCRTNVPSPPPGLLYWYREADLLEEGSRISINTTFGGIVTSELQILDAKEADSGNYTCWPTKFFPSSVIVHVLRDKEPAAMSHGTLSNGGTRNEDSKTSSLIPLSADAGKTITAGKEPVEGTGSIRFYLLLISLLVTNFGR